jgi:hypothetical protein
LRVYEVQAGVIDEGYFDSWAARIDVRDLLARLRSEAQPVINESSAERLPFSGARYAVYHEGGESDSRLAEARRRFYRRERRQGGNGEAR